MNSPAFVVPEENLIPVSDHLSKMYTIPPSRMALTSKSLAVYRQKYPDKPTFDASRGDGGASLPGTPRAVLERAAQMQIEHGTAYDMPFGTNEFRTAVIEKYWKLDPDAGIGPANVIATVGARDGLLKAFEAMLALGYGRQGDVLVLSRVPWVSYIWGTYGVGANVLLAPGEPQNGWRFTPDSIRECVKYAAKYGRKVMGIIITNPDNPTGHTLTDQQQVALGKAALETGIAFVIYDWVYHYITDDSPMDLNSFIKNFNPEERKRLIFIDALTKSLGASNIRSGHLIASEEVNKFIVSRASHAIIPDFYGQAVAMAAFEMGFAEAAKSINEPTNASRKMLKAFLDQHDFDYIMGKGYYSFINVGRWLKMKGWADTEPLGKYLAEEHGIAIVPGVYFSDYGGDWVRFSYASPPEYSKGAANRFLEGLTALEGRS